MNIVFFGTPDFAANILDFLIENSSHNIVAVVTRPDRPRGRSQKMLPSDVKARGLEKYPQIPLFQPEKASTEEFAQTLKELEADLFVVVAYGEIIKTLILDIPRLGCINIHASLLPKLRGAAPIQRSIIEGETETGVTIMEMVLKMDAGDIYKAVKTSIEENMTYGELEKKLCELSGPALLEVLEQIESQTAIKIPQDESKVTFAPKITLEDRIIDWRKDYGQLHNQIRGLSPFPGAFCFVEIGGQKKRLIIKRAQKKSLKGQAPGETLAYEKNEWIVSCGEGALSLLEVQLEGKKSLPIQEFIRGIPICPQIKIV